MRWWMHRALTISAVITYNFFFRFLPFTYSFSPMPSPHSICAALSPMRLHMLSSPPKLPSPYQACCSHRPCACRKLTSQLLHRGEQLGLTALVTGCWQQAGTAMHACALLARGTIDPGEQAPAGSWEASVVQVGLACTV